MAESLFRLGFGADADGERAGERLRLPRSPDVPRPHHAEGPPGHGPRRAGAQARRPFRTPSRSAPGSSSTARSFATESPQARRPSATTRSSRRSRFPARSSSAPTATRAWRARSGASPSASARPTWPTRGSRATCASRVPETARFVLRGRLRAGRVREGRDAPRAQPAVLQDRAMGSARCSSSRATGSRGLPLDERATLTNMAVEAGGFTGIIEADEVVVDVPRGAARRRSGRRATPDRPRRSGRRRTARRSRSTSAAVVPMVATPGDPRNGVPLEQLGPDVKIDIAYGGSCTGGKKADMDMYARVLAGALARGRARRAGRAPLSAVRLARHPPLRRGQGVPRRSSSAWAQSSSIRRAARASRRVPGRATRRTR